MKLIKLLLLFAVISSITFSCKETKKEQVDGEMEAVEESVEVVEVEGDDGGTEVVEVVEVEESAVPAEAVEASSVGLEETEIEGVIGEAMADTPVIYPGCSGSAEEIRACSKNEFITFLKKNFNAGLGADLGLKSGNHKIRSLVKIDETGKASVLKVDGPHKALEKEIVRIINKLPQLTAATEEGQPVSVSFVLPITFAVD